MELDFTEVRLPNPGVLKTRIPVRVFAELTNDLQKQVDAKPRRYNTDLAGHLETELQYNINSDFKECVDRLFREYRERFDFYRNHDYVIDGNSWVNFQKKHEYNPLHFHLQDISWVIWVTIPYDLEEEMNHPSMVESNYNVASKFQFVYNKLDGGISMYQLDIDQTWEGVLMMFPAYLKHQVYPFQTCDEHRISIAGNIKIIT
jgi:hypothetical protein